jgi:hypothetical protein
MKGENIYSGLKSQDYSGIARSSLEKESNLRGQGMRVFLALFGTTDILVCRL